MSYLERPLSRREFLTTFGVAATLIAGQSALIGRDLYGRIVEETPSFQPNLPDLRIKTFPKEENFVTNENTGGKDRIFCASTVRIEHKRENMTTRYGHGSLVAVNGEYHVYTVGHVLDIAADESSSLSIPGVGEIYLDPRRIVKTQKVDNDTEQAAYYILGSDLQTAVGHATRKKTARASSGLRTSDEK